MTIEIREYLDASGNSPYGKWFSRLNARAAAKGTIAVDRIGQEVLEGLQNPEA
ncbi:MAG: hypothetical protein U5K38_02930 [Woeseiaceae bacterium]|nr:hypothetical protein [Woeseiaceae bacterium]